MIVLIFSSTLVAASSIRLFSDVIRASLFSVVSQKAAYLSILADMFSISLLVAASLVLRSWMAVLFCSISILSLSSSARVLAMLWTAACLLVWMEGSLLSISTIRRSNSLNIAFVRSESWTSPDILIAICALALLAESTCWMNLDFSASNFSISSCAFSISFVRCDDFWLFDSRTWVLVASLYLRFLMVFAICTALNRLSSAMSCSYLRCSFLSVSSSSMRFLISPILANATSSLLSASSSCLRASAFFSSK